jgi:SAM-dependent methyltransferase
MELARRRLGALARGIEIGASAIAPFPGVRAWNVEHPSAEVFRAAQRSLVGQVAPVHVYATAERLPVADGALDFVLASHVIEHMPDAIRALGEWDRVLAVGGTMFLIVPHRERTFDRERPPTDLRHHLADFALANTAATDAMVPTSHYHVWRTAEFVALVEFLVRVGYLDWAIEEVEDVDTRAGNGFTVVARRRARPAPLAPAPADAPVAFHQLTLALPFQVPGRTLETIVPGAELPARPPVARGLYRVVPVHEGFPPRAGLAFDLAVGEPVPAPRLRTARWDERRLWLEGEHLTETTWLEGTYPGAGVQRALPRFANGALCVDFTGLPLPPGPFPVAAVTPPPGGGRSEPIVVTPPG